MIENCRVKYSEVEPWYNHVKSSRVSRAIVKSCRVKYKEVEPE